MTPPPQGSVLGSFASLMRRSLPRAGSIRSALIRVPKTLDGMIVSGSVANARDVVVESERKRELGQALEAFDHRHPKTSE